MGGTIIAVIPIRGSDDEFRDGPRALLGGRPLIEYTLLAAQAARRLDRIIVSTDSEPVAAFCRRAGVEAPFLRPRALSAPSATVTDVLRHAVEWLEAQERVQADWVVKLEITHPFRPPGIIDLLIETALAQPVDSAVLAYEEMHSYWTLDAAGQPVPVGQDVDVPRGLRRPFYRDVSGIAAMTRAANLKAGALYGTRVGLVPCRDLWALVDTHEGGGARYRERLGFRLAEALAPQFQLAYGAAEPSGRDA